MTELLYRGSIVDVDLEPTRGSETGKIRPCIIVTNNVYNQRVPVIQVVPLTEWTLKKSRIKTNIQVAPSEANGLSKLSVADCLQTRPFAQRPLRGIDRRNRLGGIRGELESEILERINHALKVVFDLV